jgi:hypothetical protein
MIVICNKRDLQFNTTCCFWLKSPQCQGMQLEVIECVQNISNLYNHQFENDALQMMSIATSALSVGQRGHYVLQQTRYGFSALPNKLF